MIAMNVMKLSNSALLFPFRDFSRRNTSYAIFTVFLLFLQYYTNENGTLEGVHLTLPPHIFLSK